MNYTNNMEKEKKKPVKKPVKKPAVCRHKWKHDYCDCLFCEAPHDTCDNCGDIKQCKDWRH